MPVSHTDFQANVTMTMDQLVCIVKVRGGRSVWFFSRVGFFPVAVAGFSPALVLLPGRSPQPRLLLDLE